jgi:hypothetical protein
MGVPIDVTYQDDGGRPIASIIDGNPINELF